MSSQSPADVGFAPQSELGELGRVRRFDCGEGRELWRFDVADRALVERLLELGRDRVGGFEAMGKDERGFWLGRAPIDPTLASRLKERGPLDYAAVLTLVASLAEALSVCESEALFPGPLSPNGVSVREGNRAELRAEPLVRSLVGAGERREGRTPGDSASPRWIAPEQAAGAAWDNAANRYVLGLMLYRLLAGEHPFAARGLRLGLDEQARRGAPPLPDEIAAKLPPGLQSFTLRLLDPDLAARPPSAREIAARLLSFLDRDKSAKPVRAARAERADQPTRKAPSDDPRAVSRAHHARGASRLPSGIRRWALFMTPVLAGAALAAGALALVDPKPVQTVEVREQPPLRPGASLAKDCASCHPRQAAEWHRSVMAHSVKSPLFQSLEMLIEEQIGRDRDCPEGAGILRGLDPQNACRDRESGLTVTGSGGELWCVNCHSPGENLGRSMPAWNALARESSTRAPLQDLLPTSTLEGISCTFCHQVHGPVRPGDLARGGYEGNPFWTSTRSGQRFESRPEDRRGLFGIANSGYSLDPLAFFALASSAPADLVPGGAHRRPSAESRRFLGSSQFCGGCHDVRLFGTDTLGVVERGEHFKRLRNAYSEWASWAERETRAGREPASCQSCHMSSFPGVCVPAAGEKPRVASDSPALDGACPPGTRFEARRPGVFPAGRASTSSAAARPVHPHYFSGVDLPLAREFLEELADEKTLDGAGIPLGARARRDMLLAASVRLAIEEPRLSGGLLQLPIVIENVGAGHRVPAGFSQERELWVHLRVTDKSGRVVYEVGRIDRPDEDLRDKLFLRVTTDDRALDGRGRPTGLFGADVADGPDAPRWSPPPDRGGARFRGRGLINFQNGFLRCVVCIGEVDSSGRCQPLGGQERARADRYADGEYDVDTGACRSNLSGRNALFETYFPVGALDATRGIAKAPDAIIDTRSLGPGEPVSYVYEIATRGTPPFEVDARLMFRAFPPYLIRAFAEYERFKAGQGRRPSGALIGTETLARIEPIELRRARVSVR